MLAAALVLAGACGAEVGPLREERRVDLGGAIATLGADGTFSIAKGDQVLVKSAGPLFARTPDPDRPDAWHDPRTPAEMVPVDHRAVGMEVVEPGVLKLTLPAQPDDTALVSLRLSSDDGFYGGLGERFDHADARGTVVPMHMAIDGDSSSGINEKHVPVPFVVSSRGYGVFAKTHEAGAFDVARTDPAMVRATFEGRSLEVFVYVDQALEVVARFARQTGLPRPLPTWALSPMHWRNEWKSGDEAIADALELRKRKIPASCLWIDNPWQTGYNTFRFDTGRFHDPGVMMQRLAALGFRPLAWSTPYLEQKGDAQALYDEAKQKGYFVRLADGQPFHSPANPVKDTRGAMIDFTSKEASAFWTSLADRAVEIGFRGFKIDYGEDLVPHLLGGRPGFKLADGTTERTARRYPVLEHAAYHASLDKAGEGILIVRASSYGGATQADIVWPGDLDNDFERHGDPTGNGKAVGGIPAAVVASQTLAASGFPVFGSDTGGYRGGKPTREALLRWAEHTALSVILQLGGGGSDHNPWTYDEEAASIYAGLARLHQQLVPYLARIVEEARTRGMPTIRSLPLAYPEDTYRGDDEYLLGPDLLVAPVIVPNVTSRSVHVPKGTWIAWWDGQIVEGPRDLEVPAPLGKPPLFVRAGALIPMQAEGVDTQVDATEPGVVKDTGELWARGVVLGDASIDGLSIKDGASVSIKATRAVYAELDLRLKKLTRAEGLPVLGNADAVKAGPGLFFDGQRLHVRFAAAGEITVSP
jgi:alpha-D-xyloside xylohydrolase